jgi:hypothetical protein
MVENPAIDHRIHPVETFDHSIITGHHDHRRVLGFLPGCAATLIINSNRRAFST